MPGDTITTRFHETVERRGERSRAQVQGGRRVARDLLERLRGGRARGGHGPRGARRRAGAGRLHPVGEPPRVAHRRRRRHVRRRRHGPDLHDQLAVAGRVHRRPLRRRGDLRGERGTAPQGREGALGAPRPPPCRRDRRLPGERRRVRPVDGRRSANGAARTTPSTPASTTNEARRRAPGTSRRSCTRRGRPARPRARCSRTTTWCGRSARCCRCSTSRSGQAGGCPSCP